MSDIREEWFKLVLDELRKNNDKVDIIREDNLRKIDELEEKIEDRLDKHELQHKELVSLHMESRKDFMASQEGMKQEHARMNDLLREHMRRTLANEQILEILRAKAEALETETKPIIEEYKTQQILIKTSTKRIKKAGLWLGIVATAIGVVSSILKFFEIF